MHFGAPDAEQACREIQGKREELCSLAALLAVSHEGAQAVLSNVLLHRLDEDQGPDGDAPAGGSLQQPPPGHFDWAVDQMSLDVGQVRPTCGGRACL